MKKRPVLGDDLPKLNPWLHGRLNYAPFAARISKIITSLAAPNGYVMGIHGQWGTGKSTAINFILSYLNKHNAEHEDYQVIHIDFRPWIVSGHQDLITAFFKILSERLGPKDSKWVRFKRRTLQFMHGTTDNLVDAAATVALTIDPTGTASGFGANVAKKSVNALLERFLEDPSLQTAYESLKDQLGRSGKRFLVTIDDIDRLEDDDVRAIMQMVKSIGQLPNVIYLLSYDRDIVWSALDKEVNRIGPRFTEKIVQQEIELPRPSRNALLAILDEEISFLTADTPNDTRWHYLVRDGITRWIRSPRDIVRLSNAVKFSWPAMENEIDAQDLLAMEGIRLFDPAAFSWIRDNRDFLFTEGRFVMSNDDVKIEVANSLKDRIPDGYRSQVMRILTILFPQAGKWFEGKDHYGEESFVEVTRRRGIGSAAGYDTYFGLHPSSDAIPKAAINDLMSKLDSADDCELIIRAYLGRTNSRSELMVAKLLDELRLRFRHPNAAMPQQGLLDALFRVGEEIISIDNDGGMFELSPRAQLMFLVRNMLDQWGTEEAGKRLVETFNKTDSVMFLAEQFVDRGRELQIFKSDSTEPSTIDPEVFAELGEILLKKIEQRAAEASLDNAAFYYSIVRAWAYLAGADQPKQWLTKGMLESADFMAKAARGLVSYSIGTPVREYSMRDNPDPDVFELDVLLKAGQKHLAQSALSDDKRNIITAVVRGVERLKKGKSSATEDSQHIEQEQPSAPLSRLTDTFGRHFLESL
ncbi:KAP family P-loop NTPase fold protein [Agrobacterium larrymoorei]|uniref:P-loop NTPase fold protein n=1 Tax=Agrobacterium larrymoorei TaxID=160699 RepID=A0AAF0KF83_9HYPH|nr:P-loop NTPase fold protein [Agrobacterium larrymoorei]WHA43225.1 P-loop NTPase fold protein [Agrobacterium larrymoorei]